jgi:hypothetical protein
MRQNRKDKKMFTTKIPVQRNYSAAEKSKPNDFEQNKENALK